VNSQIIEAFTANKENSKKSQDVPSPFKTWSDKAHENVQKKTTTLSPNKKVKITSTETSPLKDPIGKVEMKSVVPFELNKTIQPDVLPINGKTDTSAIDALAVDIKQK